MIAASPLPTSTRKGPSTPYTPITINPANEIALQRTGRDYVSWSALSTYRTCPLKYRFRYVDRLPEEFVSAALVFGTGIHTAVEQHFQMMLAGKNRRRSTSWCPPNGLPGCRMSPTCLDASTCI